MNRMLYIVLCAVAIAAGCATEEVAQPEEQVYVPQVNTLQTAVPSAKINHAAFKQVVLDGFQAQSVVVQDVRKSKTDDGYDRVQVFVKNMTTSLINTRYRFDWEDANGVVVIDPDYAGWEKLGLVPGDDGVYTSIAPRKDCADFKLRMRCVQ